MSGRRLPAEARRESWAVWMSLNGACDGAGLSCACHRFRLREDFIVRSPRAGGQEIREETPASMFGRHRLHTSNARPRKFDTCFLAEVFDRFVNRQLRHCIGITRHVNVNYAVTALLICWATEHLQRLNSIGHYVDRIGDFMRLKTLLNEPRHRSRCPQPAGCSLRWILAYQFLD